MVQLYVWSRRLLLCGSVVLLSGCTGMDPAFSQAGQFDQRVRQAAHACPTGQMRVCDRRKSVGCRCTSPRHVRALIGA
jgi:hypothetical protein